MILQPRVVPTPETDVEFLASKHMTTKTVTIAQTAVRIGQYVANQRILKAGTIMGKITASNLFSPVKKTTLAENAGTDATVIKVASAAFFQAGDVISIDGLEKTVATVDYGANEITLQAAMGTAKTAGVVVKAIDGSGDAHGILLNTLDVTHGNAGATVVTHGVVREARVLGANAQTRADLPRIEFR